MRRNDNIITIFLILFIIGIFSITVYFCLDIFNIIEIPKQYSIADFLGKKVNKIASLENIDQIINKDNIDKWINQDSIETIIINDVPIKDETNEQEMPSENYGESPEIDVKQANIVNRLYYSQLDEYGKLIYDELNSHKEDLKTGTYIADFGTKFNSLLHTIDGDVVLENAFQYAVNALLFDNPDIFYIDITKMYMSTQTISFGPFKRYEVQVGPLEGESYLLDTFPNLDAVNEAINKLEMAKTDVKLNIYGDIYTIITTIHDYLINNIEYDETLSRENIYTAYGALVSKLAVCEGYAKAFKYILDDVGIPCIIVCGDAENSKGEIEKHAWNYVKLNDKWYAIDVTWDDPIILGNGYVSTNVYRNFFLKGSKDFFKNHTETGNIVGTAAFVYPTISEENYK